MSSLEPNENIGHILVENKELQIILNNNTSDGGREKQTMSMK